MDTVLVVSTHETTAIIVQWGESSGEVDILHCLDLGSPAALALTLCPAERLLPPSSQIPKLLGAVATARWLQFNKESRGAEPGTGRGKIRSIKAERSSAAWRLTLFLFFFMYSSSFARPVSSSTYKIKYFTFMGNAPRPVFEMSGGILQSSNDVRALSEIHMSRPYVDTIVMAQAAWPHWERAAKLLPQTGQQYVSRE
ncbi:hypothetical protein C8F04DRAFT_1188647 [Mycena alexandri]|uniref:Uncharacterized protein n=1 Tax=Mycena alexandri TaxID=1745969 RepID=A0AAD6SMP1_9AGAR|nr:hypothetical protein C8F04DRAFT_1188647 [Mycena alexandri]